MTLRTRLTIRITLAAAVIAALIVVFTPVRTAHPGEVITTAIIGVALFFGLCYWQIGIALKPVHNIVQEIETITEHRLHRRLPPNSSSDEVGRLVEAFNGLLERMESSLSSQKEFVSNVSHEMRTPLAAIIAELDLALQKERSKKEYRTAIENTLADAQRMNRLIDGLLNLAKASYHKEEIIKQRLRLDELLLDAREYILKAHPNYRIEIIFEDDLNDDDRRITVLGNPYLLNIAFANLIENNCKYSADHASVIQISFWENLAIVRLSDFGIGMTETDKRNLFTLFYRGSQESVAEGHGIGMALSKRIITLHEGAINVYSEEGKGTTFAVELPHV
ncbi:MAG: HAMP domain-containing histidine kinase [Prevotella sp.]|nr:HAMP domain-containing histidine kinase [Prevotella sp.]